MTGPGRIAALCAGLGACCTAVWAETTASPARALMQSAEAMRSGDAAVALTHAREAASRDPGSADAQHAVVHASLAEAGAPTRETLGALMAAYEAAPFAAAEVMVWRVDLADAYWPAIPDPLAEATLSQIDALGRMGDDWRPRVRWCRSAVTDAIAEAACRTVPGVEKGVDLKG